MSIQKIINQYKYDSININAFLDEEGWHKDPDEKIALQVLYKSYAQFARGSGFKSFSLQNFGKHLRKLGYRVEKSTANRTYVWCVQKPDYEGKLTSTSSLI